MRDIAMCAFFVCLIRGSIRSVCKTTQMRDRSALIVLTYRHDIAIIEYIESLLPFHAKIWSTLVHVSNLQAVHVRTHFLLH